MISPTLHTEEEKKCFLERQDNVCLHPYDAQVHTLPLLYKGARLYSTAQVHSMDKRH